MPSSLHALFLSPGDPSASVEFRPLVIKQGRTLDNARVEAHQNGREILDALVSFHEPEPSIGFQQPAPEAPAPHLVRSEPLLADQPARSPFEIKPIQAAGGIQGTQNWIRLRDSFGDHPPFMHVTMLVYAIDFLISRSARAQLPQEDKYAGASLDHAMWFHRPFRSDQWLLVQGESTSYSDSRALCTATIFSEEGELVSTAHQEVLFRLQP